MRSITRDEPRRLIQGPIATSRDGIRRSARARPRHNVRAHRLVGQARIGRRDDDRRESTGMVTRDEAIDRWQGVLAPLVTPFAEDGAVDFAALRSNVAWLIDRGARLGNTVFLAAGSGGDFPMMSL